VTDPKPPQVTNAELDALAAKNYELFKQAHIFLAEQMRTVESLREQNARYREALEYVSTHGDDVSLKHHEERRCGYLNDLTICTCGINQFVLNAVKERAREALQQAEDK